MSRRLLLCTIISLVGSVILTGCRSSRETKVISLDGSSTAFPVSAALAEMFQQDRSDVAIEVRYSGTGGGFKKFCRDEIDLVNASRPITHSEMEDANRNGIEFVELPVCFDALTVVIHPSNTWAEQLTIEQLHRIWSPDSEKNKIHRWSQIRDDWPDESFTLFGAGTDSGTFDYFTEAINGKGGRSRKDFTPSEDDNVLVTGVAGNLNALGYFGFVYYEANQDKLKAVAIQGNGKKEFVPPSRQSILNGSYTPLSRPLFIYVNKRSMRKPEVKEFVEYYLANVTRACEKVGYVPLPPEAYAVVEKRFREGKTGTAFGGEPAVGLSIGEVLQREPK